MLLWIAAPVFSAISQHILHTATHGLGLRRSENVSRDTWEVPRYQLSDQLYPPVDPRIFEGRRDSKPHRYSGFSNQQLSQRWSRYGFLFGF